MVRYLAVQVGLISLVSWSPAVVRAESPPSAIGQLVLSPPVIFVNGPSPSQSRTARVGQTVVVQISYPIAPPFPTSANIDPGNGGFVPVGIFRTDGELAVLTPESRRGRIGVGFLCVVAKAIKKGETTLTAKVELSDGTVKEVPMKFSILAER